jgi:hypothetical protein
MGVFSNQGLKVGPYHIGDTTYLCVIPELVHGAAAITPAFSQSLYRHIKTDLITVLETINHRFFRTVNSYRNAINLMYLNSFCESSSREPEYADWWVIQPGGGLFLSPMQGRLHEESAS